MALAIYEIRKSHYTTIDHDNKMLKYEKEIAEAKDSMIAVDEDI